MRTNTATGQPYPETVRDHDYAVLETAVPNTGGLTTEIALVWIMTGEYTVLHVNKSGYVISDEPLHTTDEQTARDCFGYRMGVEVS